MSFFDQRLEGKTVSWQKSIAIHWPVISVRNVEFVVIRKVFFSTTLPKNFFVAFFVLLETIIQHDKNEQFKATTQKFCVFEVTNKSPNRPWLRTFFNELYLSWHFIWLCYIWCQQLLKTEFKPTFHYNAVPHFYHRGHQFPKAYRQCSLNITSNKGIVPCCTSHCGGVVTFLALSSASETNWCQNPKRKKKLQKGEKKQQKELLP